MSATRLTSHAEEASSKIDDVLDKLIAHRDFATSKLEMSDQHPEVVKCHIDELNRRTTEMVDGLQVLRASILRNELSRRETRQLLKWLPDLAQAIWRYCFFKV